MERKRKNCPRCMTDHKRRKRNMHRGTLIKVGHRGHPKSKQEYYVCGSCRFSFDFDHKSSCHKVGVMVDIKGYSDPRDNATVDFYCLECGKKCR